MTTILLNLFLMAILVFIVVMVMRTNRLFAVVVLSGAYSLICAAMFVNLDAVDVAFTEAAVGAGISTVLFLSAMAVLPSKEKQTTQSPTLTSNLTGLVVCILAGAVLMVAAFDLPAIGSPDAPVHQHVAPRYLTESDSVLHIPNVVTTVLASYRGFDTLGETIVVFTAGLGVFLLLCGATRTARRQRPEAEGEEAHDGK